MGADSGIDGLIYFQDDAKGDKKIIVSVKGGETVHRTMIADLKNTVEREGAQAERVIWRNRGSRDILAHREWVLQARPFSDAASLPLVSNRCYQDGSISEHLPGERRLSSKTISHVVSAALARIRTQQPIIALRNRHDLW